MWSACPTVLDAPTLFALGPWSVEFDDFLLLNGAWLTLAIWIDLLLAFGLGMGCLFALGLLKRGRPPGAILHALHNLALLYLPGLLPARGQTYSPWGGDPC